MRKKKRPRRKEMKKTKMKRRIMTRMKMKRRIMTRTKMKRWKKREARMRRKRGRKMRRKAIESCKRVGDLKRKKKKLLIGRMLPRICRHWRQTMMRRR